MSGKASDLSDRSDGSDDYPKGASPTMKALASGLLLLTFALPLGAQTQGAAGPFPDVPAQHWAAPAVREMKDAGIMKGYADGKFQGDKPVTRYELAVALERFIQFVEASRKPLAPEGAKPESAPTKPGPGPEKPGAWAKPSLDLLVNEQFLPKDSPLLKEGNKPADAELLAQSLTSVAVRLATLQAEQRGD